jgi:hypothetical protein
MPICGNKVHKSILNAISAAPERIIGPPFLSLSIIYFWDNCAKGPALEANVEIRPIFQLYKIVSVFLNKARVSP